MPDLTELESQSLTEIPHPSLPDGSNIYGGTKVFPDYQAENGSRTSPWYTASPTSPR